MELEARFGEGRGIVGEVRGAVESVFQVLEVFCGALELANGYVELTNAAEQWQRMDNDLEVRQQKDRRQYPADEDLIAALESGLPECAGVAVGFERLQMVFDGTDDIADVVTFASEL